MIDVLILTALPEESDAARDVALASGISKWEEADSNTPFPYLLGQYVAGDFSMNVALWRSTRMGGLSVGSVIGALVTRLKPRCLAMCGVCAGNPADVALGDVIIAELVYQYDEGKRDRNSFVGDHRQFPMPDTWVRAAQDLTPHGLPSFGEPTEADAKLWVLERLYVGDDPLKHPARKRYFEETWESDVYDLEATGWVRRDGLKLVLTEPGRSHIEQELFY